MDKEPNGGVTGAEPNKQAPSEVPITEASTEAQAGALEANTGPTGVQAETVGTSTGAELAPDSNAAPAKPKAVTGVTPEEAAKRKRMGIIGGVIGGVVALICIIVAVVMVAMRPTDTTVATAVGQLLNGGTPSNVEVLGVINAISTDEDSEISAIEINVNSVSDSVAAANDTSVTLTVTTRDGNNLSFGADEVRVTDGDTYLRVRNVLLEPIKGVINCFSEDGDLDANCDVTDATEYTEISCALDDTDCVNEVNDMGLVWNILTTAFEVVDGEWIRISDDDTDYSEVEGLFDDASVCAVDILSNMSKYGNSFSEIYNQNPFIIDQTKELGVGIEPRDNNIYRLGFDSNLLGSFQSALDNSAFAKDWKNCVGSSAISLGDVFTEAPVVYAEIDENNNFTRFYFDGNLGGEFAVTADLSFSYPVTVTVNEPEDYMDMSEALTNIVMQLFYGNLVIE